MPRVQSASGRALNRKRPTNPIFSSSGVRDPGVWVACGRWRLHVGDGFGAGVLRRVAGRRHDRRLCFIR